MLYGYTEKSLENYSPVSKMFTTSRRLAAVEVGFGTRCPQDEGKQAPPHRHGLQDHSHQPQQYGNNTVITRDIETGAGRTVEERSERHDMRMIRGETNGLDRLTANTTRHLRGEEGDEPKDGRVVPAVETAG